MDNYLTANEAAEFLDCHPQTLLKKAQFNKIPAYKRLGKWYFKKVDIENLLQPNEAAIYATTNSNAKQV